MAVGVLGGGQQRREGRDSIGDLVKHGGKDLCASSSHLHRPIQ